MRRFLPAVMASVLAAPAAAATWTAPVAANPNMPRKPPPSPPPSPSPPPPPSPPPTPPPSPWPPMQWPPQWPVPQWPVPQWPPAQPAPPGQPTPPVQPGPAPAPAPWQPPPPPREYYAPSIISIGLGFFVDVGSLPDVAPGMQVWMGLIAEQFRVEMVTDYFEDNRDGDSDFNVFGVGGRFCWRFLPWRYRAFRRGPGFSLWGCGGFEVGRINFRLYEVDPTTYRRMQNATGDTWGAARAELEGRYQIARSIAAVVVQAGAAVPFGRPELVGPEDDPFRHSPSPVVGRFGIAIAVGY